MQPVGIARPDQTSANFLMWATPPRPTNSKGITVILLHPTIHHRYEDRCTVASVYKRLTAPRKSKRK